MNDEYRDTMYFASLKRRFVREKQVKKTEFEDLTLEEVKAAMLDRIVPVYIVHLGARKSP